jgi:hypothetical protein
VTPFSGAPRQHAGRVVAQPGAREAERGERREAGVGELAHGIERPTAIAARVQPREAAQVLRAEELVRVIGRHVHFAQVECPQPGEVRRSRQSREDRGGIPRAHVE